MRSENILSLIQDTTFSTETLEELESLLEEYPYFTAAHLLYTCNLQHEKDTRLPAALRRTACYLNDRSKLFFYMESESFPPLRIAMLEKVEDRLIDSPFHLVDSFLTERNKEEAPALNPDLATKDYISYLLSVDEQADDLPSVPLKYQETIDQFIATNEKAPIKIELKYPEDTTPTPTLATLDLDSFDESSFFSETLAKIYLKQKKYEKALEIIRQLYLCNPEKNRYFADQIRFLEKLIINVQ